MASGPASPSLSDRPGAACIAAWRGSNCLDRLGAPANRTRAAVTAQVGVGFASVYGFISASDYNSCESFSLHHGGIIP
jgi:hypothetical protein